MKFFRHYKNKPYKFIGMAKHSETQEDVVIYECRYENPTAKLWVRPKDMFFSDVSIEGKPVRRFAEVPLQIESTTTVSESQISQLAPLIGKIWGEWNPEWFHGKLSNHTKFHLATALVDQRIVGFKLGYESGQGCFYSWLGGVLPEFRGLGIASDLMAHQHEWCKQQQYKKIQTETQNRYKDMLLLNLKAGFEIVGTQVYEGKGKLKIILEKNF